MRASPAAWCVTVLGLCCALCQCSRADLYPITAATGEAGATSGGGNAEATGGGSVSGTAGKESAGAAGSSTAPACPTPALSPGDATQTVTVGGVERSFLLHVPSTYQGKTPAPLLLDFHGTASSAAQERASSPYPAYVDPEGVIMAFPVGLKGPAGLAWNVGPCCVANVDDVAFARAVVNRIEQLACIDSARVYAVGTLTGGGMAHYVACHAADVFAAVAPAAFDLLEENQADCVPERPITVVTFRGTDDTRVPYEGGATMVVPGLPATFLGAQKSFERWAAIDQCVGSPSAPDANGCASYSDCAGGAVVMLCTKQGGREEPGDPSIAWPILKQHQL